MNKKIVGILICMLMIASGFGTLFGFIKTTKADPGDVILSFDSPGSFPTGLAWDGQYLWNADIEVAKIYKLTKTGSIVDSFDIPGRPIGLAWDGHYIWNADHEHAKIYKLTKTGRIVDSFDSPGPGPAGLAWDGQYLWNGDECDCKIYKLTKTGSIVDSFDTPPGVYPMGLAWDGQYLWDADDYYDKIYKLTKTGSIVDSFDSPGPGPIGLAWDGQYIWNADNYHAKIYKIDVGGGENQPNYFIHLTDTHIDCRDPETMNRLILTLQYLRGLNPSPLFLVISGDLVEVGNYDDGRNYDDFIDCFYRNTNPPDMLYLDSQKTIPVYICPGNHDHRWWEGLSAYDNKFDYPGEHGDHCYYKIHDNVRICSLDSGSDDLLSLYCDLTHRPEGNGLSQYNIDWLDSILDTETNNIIFFHHPVFNRYEGCPFDGCIVNKEEEFDDLCDSYNVGLVLCGHTHESDVYEHIANTDHDEFNDISGDDDGSDSFGHYYLTYGGDSYYKTLNVQSGTTLNGDFRKISVSDDEIKVYFLKSVINYVNGVFTVKEGESSFNNGESYVSDVALLHVYDSNGNHLGVNKTTGEIDYQIEGALYRPLIRMDNKTVGAEVSLLYGQDDYLYVIEGLQDGVIDFQLNRGGTNIGNVNMYYDNITILKGSIGKIFVNKDDVDGTIYIDENDDGIIDKEILPNNITYSDAPYTPDSPSGPSSGKQGEKYNYTAFTVDPEVDNVSYMFDWGDGTNSSWIGPYPSGEVCEASHIWTEKDSYDIRVKAKDIYGYESEWSDPLAVSMPRNRIVNNPLLDFLKQLPLIYQLLQRLLNF